MFPMRMSTIFKSRWMALVWAAGIVWFAYDFAAPSDEPGNNSTDAVQVTDADGAPVNPEEAKQLDDALNRV
jgi:hypothetical protein